MGGPNITTIINTYNQREFIAKAISSVLAQTLKSREIIVVDDGSKDGTEEFVRREFGDQVRYLYQKNGGVSNARNSGVKVSSGDWIALLDSDDYWAPDKLELQAAAIGTKQNVGMVVCEGIECTTDGAVLDKLQLPQPLTREVVHSRLRKRCTFTTSSVLIRRDALLQAGCFPEDLAFGEDWVCFANIAAAYDIVAVHKPLFNKISLQSGLGSQPQAALRDGLIALKRSTDALARRTWPRSWFERLTFRQSVSQLYLHTAWLYGRRHDKRRAVAALLWGLIHWPFLTLRQYRSMYWLCVRLIFGFD